MRVLKLLYSILLVCIPPCLQDANGQILPLQTFSLAADSYIQNQVDGFQVDWRLDLGATSMQLDLSNTYLCSAGFLQPAIRRFEKGGLWEKYNPSIELKYNRDGKVIVLVSKEPDIVLFGYKIFDLNGSTIMNNQTKYMSSYLATPIDISGMANGIYLMQVFYLPEFMANMSVPSYWVKHIKFIKP